MNNECSKSHHLCPERRHRSRLWGWAAAHRASGASASRAELPWPSPSHATGARRGSSFLRLPNRHRGHATEQRGPAARRPPAPDIPAARDKRRAPSDRARGVGLVRRGPSPKGRRGGSRGDGHGGAGGAVSRAFRGVPRRLVRCDPATELRKSPSSKSRPDAQPGLAPRAPALGGTCHAPPPTRTLARGRIPRHFGNLPL